MERECSRCHRIAEPSPGRYWCKQCESARRKRMPSYALARAVAGLGLSASQQADLVARIRSAIKDT